MTIKTLKPHPDFKIIDTKIWEDFTLENDHQPNIIRFAANWANTMEAKIAKMPKHGLTEEIIICSEKEANIYGGTENSCLIALDILIEVWEYGLELWSWKISNIEKCLECQLCKSFDPIIIKSIFDILHPIK